MPDTLVYTQHMAGSDLATVDGEIAYTYAICHVTDLGDARLMDTSDPARLFQFGWFAFAIPGAGAWEHFPTPCFYRPIWIEFENMCIPNEETQTFTQEYFTNYIRWVMRGSCEADLTFWHV